MLDRRCSVIADDTRTPWYDWLAVYAIVAALWVIGIVLLPVTLPATGIVWLTDRVRARRRRTASTVA
jgi:hypothetical protein